MPSNNTSNAVETKKFAARKDANKVIGEYIFLTGRIGSMSEEWSVNGRGYTRASLAVGSTGKNSTGERWTRTQWYKLIAWGPLGQALFDCAEQGSAIWIVGKPVQFRQVDESTGEVLTGSKVVIEDWGFTSGQPK